jgi:hypothetical protein
MPDARIDTRFQLLPFPPLDIYLRNTLVRSVHRKGMGYARTFSSFDSPYDSVLSSFIHLFDLLNYADVGCMRLSKPGPSRSSLWRVL